MKEKVSIHSAAKPFIQQLTKKEQDKYNSLGLLLKVIDKHENVSLTCLL